MTVNLWCLLFHLPLAWTARLRSQSVTACFRVLAAEFTCKCFKLTSLHFTSLNISYFIVFAARYLYYFILILCTYTCLMVIVCCALFQCNFTCSSVLFSTEELPCGILRNHSGIYLISSDTYHSKFTSMRSGWPTQFYCNHGKTSESNRSYRCNVFLILVVFQQSRLHRGNMQTSESDHQRSCR